MCRALALAAIIQGQRSMVNSVCIVFMGSRMFAGTTSAFNFPHSQLCYVVLVHLLVWAVSFHRSSNISIYVLLSWFIPWFGQSSFIGQATYSIICCCSGSCFGLGNLLPYVKQRVQLCFVLVHLLAWAISFHTSRNILGLRVFWSYQQVHNSKQC